MDQLDAHHQVAVEELGRAVPVGANSAYQRCQVQDHVRLGVCQHTADVCHLHQVVILDERDEDFLGAMLAQLFNYE